MHYRVLVGGVDWLEAGRRLDRESGAIAIADIIAEAIETRGLEHIPAVLLPVARR